MVLNFDWHVVLLDLARVSNLLHRTFAGDTNGPNCKDSLVPMNKYLWVGWSLRDVEPGPPPVREFCGKILTAMDRSGKTQLEFGIGRILNGLSFLRLFRPRIPWEDIYAAVFETEFGEKMVKLLVRDKESIQEAVRRFRKLVERSGIKKEMRRREFYEKPSETKRRTRLRAERRSTRTRLLKTR